MNLNQALQLQQTKEAQEVLDREIEIWKSEAFDLTGCPEQYADIIQAQSEIIAQQSAHYEVLRDALEDVLKSSKAIGCIGKRR